MGSIMSRSSCEKLHRALLAIPRPLNRIYGSSTTATGSWPVAIPWASVFSPAMGIGAGVQGGCWCEQCVDVLQGPLFVTKWSTVQSKASKGLTFAMDDTSKKSEPAVRG